jgi:hypothetical protein
MAQKLRERLSGNDGETAFVANPTRCKSLIPR